MSPVFAAPLSVHIKSLFAHDKYAFWSAYYLALADEEALAKIVPVKNSVAQSLADRSSHILKIGIGVLTAILGAAAVYLIRNYFDIPL